MEGDGHINWRIVNFHGEEAFLEVSGYHISKVSFWIHSPWLTQNSLGKEAVQTASSLNATLRMIISISKQNVAEIILKLSFIMIFFHLFLFRSIF